MNKALSEESIEEALIKIQELKEEGGKLLTIKPSFMIVNPVALKGIKGGIDSALKVMTGRKAKQLRKLKATLDDNN